ncbi:MAG: RsmB/NOP family class I SAM-dependent RNA methyltransferase [Bacteroidia bacterium]|nr:RsmB/NOP family class I SAM-dependent RNA methyltransferase [Bacteroidia bacterium]
MHYILFQRLTEALSHVFKNGTKADKALELIFNKYKSTGSRDRKWIAGWFYEVVRYYERYAFCAQTRENLWEICGTALLLSGIKLPDFSDFKNLKKREKTIWKNFEFAKKDDFIFESFPKIWKILNEKERLEQRIPGWMKMLNREALPIIRVNTIKTSALSLEENFKQKGISVKKVPGYPDLFILPDKRNYFQTSEFKEGWFEFQDTGSYEIGKFCCVKPGMKVMDICAGAGGKTLHLACLMENKGKIICTDIHESKLIELKKRTARAGIQNTEIFGIISDEKAYDKLLKKYHEWADVVLLDAPCTGSGVIKRNPDVKYKIDIRFLNDTIELQRKILTKYSPLVKKNGYLVYATCSIFESENEKQTEWFCKEFKIFKKIEEKFLPPTDINDGFYMCKFQKTSL